MCTFDSYFVISVLATGISARLGQNLLFEILGRFSAYKGGNDHEIYEYERTIGHTEMELLKVCTNMLEEMEKSFVSQSRIGEIVCIEMEKPFLTGLLEEEKKLQPKIR